MRHMLREIFERNEFCVVGEASNGKEAVKKYEELTPDITTLDITMPGMDGIQALKAIMEIDPAAKVVMVSAMGSKSDIIKAVKAGAKNFVIKPFEEQKVIDAVKSIIDK